MTAPSYTTDLNPVSLAEDTTGWTEMTGRTSGGAAAQEDRAYIQGNYCVSQSTGTATGKTVGLQYDYGSNITWTSGWVVFVWQYWQAPKAIATWANGGVRFAIGSANTAYNLWNTQGNDAGRNPYGGWYNVAIDPTYTPDETIGSATEGAYRWFASAPNLLSSVSKGNPHCVDAIRYGRGTLIIEYGATADGYATFTGAAATNDADSARWGIFTLQQGTYLYKGVLSFGTSSNATDFRDSNKTIIIDDAPRTYADFARIELRNASSRVDWTNISFSSTGTLAKGRLECIDDVDLNGSGCTFISMDTFILKAASELLNTTWLNCNTITAAGANLSGSKCLTPTVSANTSAVVWDVNTETDGKLDGMIFTKGTNAHHAIELGTTSPTSVTLRNITFSGFSASNSQNDSALHIKRTTGTVTISVISCTGDITYKSEGATVAISVDPVTLSVHVQDSETGDPINGARVLVTAGDVGPKPYHASVTIARTDSTATVSHTDHGLATNDYVVISGANQPEYNGVHQITYSSANAYTFTVSGTPDTPATGTIISTFAPISNTTNASGNVSDSRSYTSNQDIEGRVRMATGGTLYKTAPISGTIDSSKGLSVVVQLIPDD